jgi:hypothetical protein
MDCVSVTEAKYLHDYTLWLKFNTGETGEADLREVIFKFAAASPIRNQDEFAKFHLDEWPTVAWDCGFDLDPEYLYQIVTGKSVLEPQEESQRR